MPSVPNLCRGVVQELLTCAETRAGTPNSMISELVLEFRTHARIWTLVTVVSCISELCRDRCHVQTRQLSKEYCGGLQREVWSPCQGPRAGRHGGTQTDALTKVSSMPSEQVKLNEGGGLELVKIFLGRRCHRSTRCYRGTSNSTRVQHVRLDEGAGLEGDDEQSERH